MKLLTEAEIIKTMQEEWDANVKALIELKASGNIEVISNELKVKHKKSGIRYTIDSISRDDVVLRRPEGDQILVDKAHLQADYEVA